MLSFARSNVLDTPKWPLWTCFSISARSDFGMTIFWPRNIKPPSIDNSSRWFQYSGTDCSHAERVSGQPWTIVFCKACICLSCRIASWTAYNLFSVTKNCCKTACTCKSRPADKFSNVSGKSLTGISFPRLWMTPMLYFCSYKSVLLRRGGAAETGFRIMCLWSEFTVTSLP